MKKFSRLLPLIFFPLLLSACAAGPKGKFAGGGPARADRAGPADPVALLAGARAERDEKGCVAAAPAFRVVAAMGEGREAAQHELGECLLSATGATETESALLRDEGLFWLTRAAYAGNARAQRALSVWYGTGNNPSYDGVEALKWTLIYGANPEAELYGFASLPATYEPGLRADLSAEDISAAEAAANAFKPVSMAAFEPPQIERDDASHAERPQSPPEGGRRPRQKRE